jgi:hypothetical protein
MSKPTLVVFLGNLGSSRAEQLVAHARCAATFDVVETALSTGTFERAILATDDDSGLPTLTGLETDVDGGPFAFGPRLAGLIEQHHLERVVYLGGGSLPLLDAPAFAEIAGRLVRNAIVITNNAFSSDIIGFPVSESVLGAIRTSSRDNALARALEERAGLMLEELPRTVATQFDIDAPSDLAVLALTGEGGPRLRDYLHSLVSNANSTGQALSLTAYQRTLPLFTSREAQIIVAGRVGSHAWRYLERETACRVRLFAEERGLEAEGRADDRTARSLLGFFIESAGLDRFFEILPQLGDAAFIDTRVLLAHFGIEATREDRFLSDLGRWGEIREPFLRDLTRGAVEASIPVLLGGHSLMSGGLMALNEHAWREHETSGR